MVFRALGLRTLSQRSKRLFGVGIPTSSSTVRNFLLSTGKLQCSNITENSVKKTSQKVGSSQPFGFQPYGEPGSGAYGKLHPDNNAVTAAVKPHVLKTIDPLVRESSGLFSIGDYGTADGASSLELIGDIIGKIREWNPNRPVMVVYEDQPANDYNSIFRRLHGEIPDPPSYLKHFRNVFTMATATSFYEQVVPDSSMDVILSFFAMHWSSQRPTRLQNTVFSCFDISQEERRLVEEQGARDWETILLQRAKELKPGGVLIAAVVTDNVSSPTRICNQDTLFCLNQLWLKYRDTGKITQEEFLNTNFDVVFRPPEAVVAPFESPDSPVRRAGLSLLDFHTILLPRPFNAEYKETLERNGVDDRARIARKMVNACRTFTNSTLVNGLDPQRSNKEEVVESLYNEMVDCLQKLNFDSFKTDMPLGYICVKKS